MDKLNKLFDSLLSLRNSGLKIDIVKLSGSEVEKAQEITNKLLGRKSNTPAFL